MGLKEAQAIGEEIHAFDKARGRTGQRISESIGRVIA